MKTFVTAKKEEDLWPTGSLHGKEIAKAVLQVWRKPSKRKAWKRKPQATLKHMQEYKA